jgi:hypothetical protein
MKRFNKLVRVGEMPRDTRMKINRPRDLCRGRCGVRPSFTPPTCTPPAPAGQERGRG